MEDNRDDKENKINGDKINEMGYISQFLVNEKKNSIFLHG